MPLPVVGKAHEAKAQTEFVWFIYGSSLSKRAFAAWAQEHGYQLPDFSAAFPARLDGYRLAFDVMSRFWGGATADLVPAPGSAVEGIALPLPGSARGLVDHKEGAISGLYEPFEVQVKPLAGGAPSAAIAYRAAASRRLTEEAPPSETFLETLLEGAREWKLSEGWIGSLAAR
ncbi:MAG TPA: gamma-glutamylcyclotransferase family protein [Myxococcales bacterium]|nr:gamma-glutamylcyclotransferase family protein [Myxococcales bacterium]